ncbi:MAG: aminotransferase class V-fold PLP-dependent enzyme [Gemmatimonadetes bacterium]|nr:aminotransferase class V-fold PLP-dependent enzyme [Gemmatimonadota bacterium]
MATDTLSAVRAREYPAPRDGIFFNAASWGLLPASAAQEVADLTLRRNRTRGFEERELGRIQHRCRGALAGLLDVAVDEIALVPNTSFGVSLAAALVARGKPGTIVVSAGEFPANVLPWKSLERIGFHLCVVPLAPDGLPDEAALLDALSRSDVRALSVSSVQFSSGVVADLAPLGAACRKRGILFCVDAIQGLGVCPFRPNDVQADIVACGGQKWLCAPWGSGFAWVRKELHGHFDSPIVSWVGIEGSSTFVNMLDYELDWRTNARKFEPATLGIQDYLGLARAVEVLMEVGIDAIRAHVRDVQEPLIAWASNARSVRLWTPQEEHRRAGIVSFIPPDVDRSSAALRAEGVVFSVREGAIRFAPHFFNQVEEMSAVVDVLDRVEN